jgi:hypothetical protein
LRSSLLTGLFLSLSALPAAWSAPPLANVVEKDGVKVIIMPTIAAGAGPETSIQVGLDLEAMTDDAAARVGFRSMRGRVAFDCGQGVNLLSEAVAYDRANLEGEGKPKALSGKWIRPAPQSLMAAVGDEVCKRPLGTSPVKVTVQNPPAPNPPAQPASPTAAAPTAAASSAPPSPARKSAIVAQASASPTAKGAQGVLKALGGLITPPLAGAVDEATVQGAKVYRADVAGFSSMAEAKAFCAKAASVTKTCWTRRSD